MVITESLKGYICGMNRDEECELGGEGSLKYLCYRNLTKQKTLNSCEKSKVAHDWSECNSLIWKNDWYKSNH